jgi:hypothetical protein
MERKIERRVRPRRPSISSDVVQRDIEIRSLIGANGLATAKLNLILRPILCNADDTAKPPALGTQSGITFRAFFEARHFRQRPAAEI